jgi:amidophosphoribosyltransferase
MRPFSVAKLGTSVLFASESCSFETVGVDVHWDVGPGEMIVVTKEGMTAKQLAKPTPRFDIFEFVYFARPDSIILGQSVYQVRWDFGKALANWPGFSG